MWLDKIKDLKKQTGTTTKSIAELLHRSERTISRFLSGETDLGIDEVCSVVQYMGGSMDDILAESDFKMPVPEIESLKKEIADFTIKIEEMEKEKSLLNAEIGMLKEKNAALTAENDILRMKLAYEEKISALHSYYQSRQQI